MSIGQEALSILQQFLSIGTPLSGHPQAHPVEHPQLLAHGEHGSAQPVITGRQLHGEQQDLEIGTPPLMHPHGAAHPVKQPLDASGKPAYDKAVLSHVSSIQAVSVE